MIITECTIRFCRARTIIVIGVIACLCFSVGEGLRLTPFPTYEIAGVMATNTHLNATTSFETSLRKYGPLDVPTRVQKRGKRQAVDFYPPSEANRKLAAHQVRLPGASETVGTISVLFGLRPKGRAPPFIS